MRQLTSEEKAVAGEGLEGLILKHDVLNRNTKAQLEQVIDALRELMTPPDPPSRPIGFVTP